MRTDLPHYDAYGQLWLAVLQKAVEDASTPLQPAQNHQGDLFYQRRARLWMLTARKGVGSLNWICNLLNIDPEAIRAEVRRRIEHGIVGVVRRGSSARFISGPPKHGKFHGNQHTEQDESK